MTLQWMHEVRIEINNGTEKATFSSKGGQSENNFAINFTVPFSDEPTPSECTVDIFNLSTASQRKITKGSKVTIYAGYKGDVGILSEGTITQILPTYGVDHQLSFTLLEGQKYEDKKEVNITFAQGTSTSTIIRRISQDAGIPISQMNLSNDKVYGSGYTADGDAMSVIEEVVKACGDAIYYRRGKLIIRNIKVGENEKCILSFDSGLIEQPQRVENDDYKGYSLQCLLQHRISTASLVEIKTKYVNGTFHVKNGQHSFDGSSFTTSCEVI